MNIHQKRTLIAGFVAAIVLTALFILISATPLAIAAYCFGLLAVIELFGAIFMAAGSTKNSYLTNAAFPLVAYSYAAANFLFSASTTAMEYFGLWTMPVKWFICIQIIFAAVLIWRLLAMQSGQEMIEASGQEVKRKVSCWKNLGADMEALRDRAPESCWKPMQDVIDAIRYADPMSEPEMDSEIKKNISLIAAKLDEQKTDEISAICVEIRSQIKIRNTRLKLSK